MDVTAGPRNAVVGRRFGLIAAITARYRLPVRCRRPSALAFALAALAAALLLAAAVGLLSWQAPKGGVRAVTAAVASAGVYHSLPEITVDLRSARPPVHYVQLAAVIEVAGEDAAALQAREAIIVADLQLALRDLARQDLAGASGGERARALFIRIIDRHLAPAHTRSVLFTKFLVD